LNPPGLSFFFLRLLQLHKAMNLRVFHLFLKFFALEQKIFVR